MSHNSIPGDISGSHKEFVAKYCALSPGIK